MSRDSELQTAAMALPCQFTASDPNKSSIDGKDNEEEEETGYQPDENSAMYDDAFTKMKRAAGVSSIEEVVKRFETQEGTGRHLEDLQTRAEKEIRDLGAVKEGLEAEWELVKFMGQEENMELREKLEKLEFNITEQQLRKQLAEEKLQLLNKLLQGIKTGLESVTNKLFAGDPVNPPPRRNSMEQLALVESKTKLLMDRLSGYELAKTKEELEEDNFVPIGLGLLLDGHLEEDEAKKEGEDSGPEDEEVPTRGYLKRQSNLILDAKSRSKRGGKRR